MRTVQALVRADHLRTLSLFELRMLPSHAPESRSVTSLAGIERLAGAAFVVTTDAISRLRRTGIHRPIGRMGGVRQQTTVATKSAGCLRALCLPLPRRQLRYGTRRTPSQRAIEQLESEVRHVASAVH